VAFADSEEGESIKSFVQLVEQHGENKLWPAVKGAHDDEKSADVVLSTAHKAKGREWDSVRLTADFASSRTDAEPADNEAETRLFYVAMTRAKSVLAVDPALLTHFTTEAGKSRAASSSGEASRAVNIDPAPEKKTPLWKRLIGG
jgi:superfamily I DNA/RNA helicase